MEDRIVEVVWIGAMIDSEDSRHRHLDHHHQKERGSGGFRQSSRTEGVTGPFQGHVTCVGNGDIGRTIALQEEGEVGAAVGEVEGRINGKLEALQIEI